jgi:hypothetical protein
MTGHEYAMNQQLATERYQGYLKDAETYRNVSYGRLHSRSRSFATWLGNLLLEWGRSLRERSGEVIVEIATSPGPNAHPERAA